MNRKISMTDEQLISELRSVFGTELTAADIKGYCASQDLSYPTVTRRLEPYKTDRGRWNLEVTQERVEEIERSTAPLQSFLVANRILFLKKNSTFVPFGSFRDIKKSSSLVFSILFL